jgi:glutamate-1-semialdehyde 2,1-aminomutase
LTGTAEPFRYNQIKDLEAIVAAAPEPPGAIVLEPARNEGPEGGFLEDVRAIADKTGAVLIFDEVTSGWRMNTGGIHRTFGVDPDVAVFSKALGNGYPIAAVIGRSAVMDAAQSSFISSTFWTEKIGPVAALATIRKHRAMDVPTHLVATGRRVQQGWRDAAATHGLPLEVSGIPPLSHFHFDRADDLSLTTLFTQEMLGRSFLAGSSFYASFAHQPGHVDDYLEAVSEVFAVLADAIEHGNVGERLHGPERHSSFQRLN